MNILRKTTLLGAAMAMPFTLGACAGNYAVEGAAVGAAAGAVVAGATDRDVGRGAAIGAAAGAVAGYFIDKNNRCDGYDRNGRLDDDCRNDPRYRR